METLYQFIRFACVGVANTAVDFGVYFFLTRFVPFFPDHIYSANVIAFIAAASFSFLMNRSWTFRREDRVKTLEAVKFFLATSTGFLINTGILYIVVQEAHGTDVVGKIGATVVTVVWNFMLNKFWVFARPRESQLIS